MLPADVLCPYLQVHSSMCCKLSIGLLEFFFKKATLFRVAIGPPARALREGPDHSGSGERGRVLPFVLWTRASSDFSWLATRASTRSGRAARPLPAFVQSQPQASARMAAILLDTGCWIRWLTPGSPLADAERRSLDVLAESGGQPLGGAGASCEGDARTAGWFRRVALVDGLAGNRAHRSSRCRRRARRRLAAGVLPRRPGRPAYRRDGACARIAAGDARPQHPVFANDLPM